MAGFKHDENGFEKRFEIVILPMEDLKRFIFCHSSQIKTLYYYTDSRKFDKMCCEKIPM